MEALSAEDRQPDDGAGDGRAALADCAGCAACGLLARPEQRLAEPVAIALRMGAFQLLHMDRIPAHAALSESVELCRAAGQPHAAGMVNAVLRKLAAAQSELEIGMRGELHESTAAFAERLGHPRWLVERWVTAYGREAALTICEDGQREPERGAIFAGADGVAAWPVGEMRADGRWIAAGGGDCGGGGAAWTRATRRVGLLCRSGWEDVDAGAAVGRARRFWRRT